ncbi:hypothetical protein [Caballeronia humi]|uniref:Uncharacterized protein n=1 Tax=Caballeronia humi TaxID=326474 RepID=A0A158HDU6_9BURK|nr:hypothetical protein [Caballeronia humi]SAL42572.1 hypothetical protein AWB65_03244 [Caballeronia humi]
MNLAFIQNKRRSTIDLPNRHDNVPALPSQRVLVSAAVYSEQDEASRERIRRLFHSPLGVYVSHASRNQSELRLEFDVATEDIEFTLRTLKKVLPEAVIEEIRPRVFERREH